MKSSRQTLCRSTLILIHSLSANVPFLPIRGLHKTEIEHLICKVFTVSFGHKLPQRHHSRETPFKKLASTLSIPKVSHKPTGMDIDVQSSNRTIPPQQRKFSKETGFTEKKYPRWCASKNLLQSTALSRLQEFTFHLGNRWMSTIRIGLRRTLETDLSREGTQNDVLPIARF